MHSSPVHFGRTLVNTRHGVLPTPSPAALELLKGVPAKISDIDAELVTPTGAGILKALSKCFGEMPQINILVLTVSDDESDLFAAVKFGARGYILKNAEPEELTKAIFHIAQGGVIISPLMAAKLLTEFKDLAGGAERKISLVRP